MKTDALNLIYFKRIGTKDNQTTNGDTENQNLIKENNKHVVLGELNSDDIMCSILSWAESTWIYLGSHKAQKTYFAEQSAVCGQGGDRIGCRSVGEPILDSLGPVNPCGPVKEASKEVISILHCSGLERNSPTDYFQSQDV